jgi:hypothetical protein
MKNQDKMRRQQIKAIPLLIGCRSSLWKWSCKAMALIISYLINEEFV